MLELIGLLVSVARQRRRDGLKLAVSVFLADQMSDKISVCICVLLKEHLHYGVAVHKFLSRSSDCQELLTYV